MKKNNFNFLMKISFPLCFSIFLSICFSFAQANKLYSSEKDFKVKEARKLEDYLTHFLSIKEKKTTRLEFISSNEWNYSLVKNDQKTLFDTANLSDALVYALFKQHEIKCETASILNMYQKVRSSIEQIAQNNSNLNFDHLSQFYKSMRNLCIVNLNKKNEASSTKTIGELTKLSKITFAIGFLKDSINSKEQFAIISVKNKKKENFFVRGSMLQLNKVSSLYDLNVESISASAFLSYFLGKNILNEANQHQLQIKVSLFQSIGHMGREMDRTLHELNSYFSNEMTRNSIVEI